MAAALAKAADKEPAMTVFTLAERADGQVVRCVGGLRVQPEYHLTNHPPIDLLVVPGGCGTRREIDNTRLIDWCAPNPSKRSSLRPSAQERSYWAGRDS